MVVEPVYFIEETHTYWGVETGLQYSSVSHVSKCIMPYVDWDTIKKFSARKRGISVEELQADWDFRALQGTTAGTLVHKDIEDEVLESFFVERFGTEFYPVPYIMAGDKKFQIKDLKGGRVYPELILNIIWRGVRIAGTSDLVYITQDGVVHIEDAKTDIAIEYEGYRGQKLATPLDHRNNCNFDIYSLKMSTYMFMLLEANPDLKPGQIVIRHQPLEREDRIPVFRDGKPVVLGEWDIPVDYESNRGDVIKMLDTYADQCGATN